MSFNLRDAEELARASLPEGMFDELPEAARQALIDQQAQIESMRAEQEAQIESMRAEQEANKEKIIDEWIVEREKTIKRPDIDAMRLAGMKDRVREEEPEPVFRPHSERFDID